eukprot:TRINITY_DN38870_c0_g1_i1.p1 TRINITY_DN38870_c0_g1~~TRINITY_DN38870_c0_g1_i1.p1  ORF type:complete len:281 (+),score=38.16 TRINITY_DN38870_c0_g1_i1:142-984(+)
MASTHTTLQSASVPTGRLHPTVVFNICDSYVRRHDQSERVIGTLLGTVSADGTIDIRNSYSVPHTESSDQVALDIDYHRNMFELHQKVNPKEVIIGWYSTGSGVTGSSALIQDFYSREAPNPVHLTIDTSFQSDRLIKAYISRTLSLGDRQLAAEFHEIPLDLRMVEAERVGYDILTKTAVDKLPNDLEGLEATMQGLYTLIDEVLKYVDDAVQGHVAPDNTIGRYLMDTVAMIPKMSPEAFDKLFNESIQDLLLVNYLGGLTRAQLALAEKLNTAAQVL